MLITPETARRWSRRPEGSTWGDWGPADELGRLNLLTPAKVLEGVAEVREGICFCLSLPLEYPGGNVLNPRRHPPALRPTVRPADGRLPARVNMNFPVCDAVPDATDVICDDLAVLHLQYSTQWDSLAHVGSLFDADGDGRPEPVFYNGFRAGEDVVGPTDAADAGVPSGLAGARSTSRAKALGIERLAERGMQGRGVMIDLHAHHGRERVLVGYDALMRVIEADRVAVEPGDMVCLHTGFGELLLEMGGMPDGRIETSCAALDGRDRRLLNWITDSGLAALIADNYAVEALPARPEPGCCATLPLHEHCLFRLGVNLGELWHLTPLATWLRAAARFRFLLTAPPLRLTGAVGSPTTPIATV